MTEWCGRKLHTLRWRRPVYTIVFVIVFTWLLSGYKLASIDAN